YGLSNLTAPWGFTMPPMPDYLWFHVVTSGAARLETAPGSTDDTDDTARLLRPGNVALVPRGEGHVLRSDPGVFAPGILDLERESVSDLYEILTYGGGGRPTTLLCGAIRFDHPAARNLIEVLPSIIHIETADSPYPDRIHSTLALLAAEAKELRPGGEGVITRLADILVIQAIRTWIETDPAAQTGWLGALSDPQIGQAISLIHRNPAREWTVAALADELAMSRSAFAARFTELVGEPAMHYVTRWRMSVALDALQDDGATIAELAGKLGYRSDAAFARAFKRVTGRSPGAVNGRRTEDRFVHAGRTPMPAGGGRFRP
ncbi:MAG: AraC family transcriptional regulator, partial [Chloroflexota bacterium]|nr:AraC family transcriptional regulator [Chloroflexota bacterium]